MKSLLRLKEKLVVGFWLSLFGVLAQAQTALDLTNISGTSGAGTKQITDLAAKTTTTANTLINTVLVLSGFAGVCLVIGSVWAIYKASKDDRESPKTAIVGIFVGGAMTFIAVIVGMVRNFYQV